MAAEYFEKIGISGSQLAQELEVPFLVRGAATFDIAKVCVQTNAALSVGGRTRLDFKLDEIADSDMWEGTVKYGIPGSGDKASPSTGSSAFQFDTTGATSKIYQGEEISVDATDDDPGTGVSFEGAIGVKSDKSGAEVEGVDVTVPVFKFSGTLYKAAADMTPTYINNLYKLTGTVNDARVTIVVDGIQLTFEDGELLFLGAKGAVRGGGDWELELDFAASPNQDDIVVGDLTVAHKDGWDYLWVQYTDHDTDDGILVKKPRFAVVNRVYKRADHSQLQLPAA